MKIIVTFLLCCLTPYVDADTEIKVVADGGQTQVIKIQGDWLRAEQEVANEDYLIADLNQGMIYAVLPQQQKIIEISSTTDSPTNSDLNAELRLEGDGPVIAGYKTQQYSLLANKQPCGSTFISEGAAQNKDISNMLNAMANLNVESMIPAGMKMLVQGMMDPCAKAGFRVMKQTTQLGFPVKVIDEKGRSAYELISIDDTVKLDSKIFTLPVDYVHTTPQKMINDSVQKAMKQISPEQQKMIEEMLRQMGEQMQQK